MLYNTTTNLVVFVFCGSFACDMIDKHQWTMIVEFPDGTKKEYTGNKTLTEMLVGAKEYLNKLKNDGRNKKKD